MIKTTRYLQLSLLLTLLLSGCSVDKLIFYPPERASMPPLPGQIMLKVSPETKIAAQFIRSKKNRCWILYSHGNATDLYGLQSSFMGFVRHGYSVAGYDYEGYGLSNGSPSENAACRDIETVYRYMTRVLKIPPVRIIVYGRSVGSGPACYLAEKYKVSALVLESPFTTISRVVTDIPVPFDRFPNIDRINKTGVPLLIYHGGADKVIDVSHGKALYDKSPSPKTIVIIPEAGHNNLKYTAPEIYWPALSDFVDANTR